MQYILHITLYVTTVILLYVPTDSNVFEFEPQSVINVFHMIREIRDCFPEQHYTVSVWNTECILWGRNYILEHYFMNSCLSKLTRTASATELHTAATLSEEYVRCFGSWVTISLTYTF
jgi:hypothetical protein